ncbi:hypothetical protein N510_001662 [Firmicutes bacterium ASF500]|nr:hypothetical protein N510_001662 [Firmicutes bacterium ASF500]
MLPIKIELPEGFLEEEVRCGYTISPEMKKLWAVELDLLAEFDRVCGKHGLAYFAFGGTLLGAVRHKGYIPWDDDIDLLMFREDYRKLVQIAEQEFQHPYFFQTPFTDPGLVMGGSRLRNSDTTLISDFENKRPYENKGIFIDIFVLDNVPDSEAEFERAKKVLKYYWRILRYASYYEGYFQPDKRYPLKRRILGRFARLLKGVFGMERLSRGYEQYCSQWSGKETRRISPIETWRGRFVYQREQLKTVYKVPFEQLEIPVSDAFDEMLTAQYGDYMTLKKISSTHHALTFDAEMPYKDYALKIERSGL